MSSERMDTAYDVIINVCAWFFCSNAASHQKGPLFDPHTKVELPCCHCAFLCWKLNADYKMAVVVCCPTSALCELASFLSVNHLFWITSAWTWENRWMENWMEDMLPKFSVENPIWGCFLLSCKLGRWTRCINRPSNEHDRFKARAPWVPSWKCDEVCTGMRSAAHSDRRSAASSGWSCTCLTRRGAQRRWRLRRTLIQERFLRISSVSDWAWRMEPIQEGSPLQLHWTMCRDSHDWPRVALYPTLRSPKMGHSFPRTCLLSQSAMFSRCYRGFGHRVKVLWV